ncbi:hypothetical protein KIW84_013361 [Lathyrus oleraceus]|uniref:Protein kinase domain-containing protein n=1 Tax=Pisum sativum TaxID=3888 RepID=A0A9D5BK65_PEA|nr:hypothetical protein KIW84_013361 [Pisum sativum]
MNLSSDVHGLPEASVSDAEIKPNDLPYHNGVEHVHASYLKPAGFCVSCWEDRDQLFKEVEGIIRRHIKMSVLPSVQPFHEIAYPMWLTSAICEIWFALSGILDQFPKWSPINREIYLDRLAIRYDRDGEPSQLALIDVFISTENPLKEPPLITANTVLSILSVDYPVDKVSCYVSDDGSAMLTFEALSETTEFAKKWLPFCNKHNIEPSSPEADESKLPLQLAMVGRLNVTSSAQDLPMPYGYKSNISFGCCMFEIVAYQPAFHAPNNAEVINKISRSAISPLPIAYSLTLKQFIKSMLRKNPEHRPTAADLLRHALNISNVGTLC